MPSYAFWNNKGSLFSGVTEWRQPDQTEGGDHDSSLH